MTEPSLRMYRGPTPGQWGVQLNGRQALQEGPRRIGHCVHCAGPCAGATTQCEGRVFSDAMAIKLWESDD